MTYLQMAGENAHHFVQEQYFAGTLLEKVDEATMVRLAYNQPGWVRRRGQYLHVRLQGYSDPEVQAAVAQACQRVNQAQVKLSSGHRLRMEVATDAGGTRTKPAARGGKVASTGCTTPTC